MRDQAAKLRATMIIRGKRLGSKKSCRRAAYHIRAVLGLGKQDSMDLVHDEIVRREERQNDG